MDSPGQEGDPGTAVQHRLRAALGQALRRRDSIAVAALRSALGAIANAEALPTTAPAAGPSSPHLAGALAGLGAGEAPRRHLTAAQAGQIIQAEISERRRAADGYERAGQPGRAQRLRAEADVLASVTAADAGAMEEEKRAYLRPDAPGDPADDP